ncbi:hypothetical protein VTJ49DRAFT_52 [Mycothermus thermophilus]|uniref:S-adenosylmethionine-dependent methyltransferase-like protein n=1 Tax=Humicola insolens TaxID=85995 RepID=A0ABR3VRT1_HUMIN
MRGVPAPIAHRRSSSREPFLEAIVFVCPSGASPNTAFSPRDSSLSFQPDPNVGSGNHASQHHHQQQQQQQQQEQQTPPPPPPHHVNIYTGSAAGTNPTNLPPQLQHSASVSSSSSFDSRQRGEHRHQQHDFADQVTRSQSYRYPPAQSSPTSTQQLLAQQQQQQQQQHQPHFHHQHHHHSQAPPPGSSSVEDLSNASDPNISSPILGGPSLVYSPQSPPPAQTQFPKSKQSTRNRLRNILNPRGQDFSHLQQNSQPGSAPVPGRRNSKRVSLPSPYPPILRSGGSQVSLDPPQQLDWQNQGPATHSSPQQGVGDFHEPPPAIRDSDQHHLHLQIPQDAQNPTIRAVPPDADTSPYSGVQQQYQVPGSQHQQAHYQAGNPQAFSGHLANPQIQNPETVSQLSHESPATDSDQRSASNVSAQAISYQQAPIQDIPASRLNPPHAAQATAPPPQQHQHQQQNMAPPAGGPPPGRRSQDADKMRDQAQGPSQPPPSYRQSQQPNMNPLPPPPNAGVPNPNFPRPNNVEPQGEVPGRNSPQPPPPAQEQQDQDKAFKDLLTKYKNVKRLYFDGKKEIEHLNAQVEQLQNAIANQRMSQSRTSLDDSEYTTRFNRLNGAINNLAFNIRKDWVSLPAWLVPFVSADALKTGKQEMTAVGRAVIARWIVDEIFNRCFHPGLDPALSRQLKAVELNIRHFSYTMNSQEEFEALTSKVVAWRMATLEGLQDVLRSPESTNHRHDFTRRATSNLTAHLFQHLADPPPPGVDGSASMIVELAVGIASNLPLESRDVAITYPLPESPIQPDLMEVEKTGLPALEPRPSDTSAANAAEDQQTAAGNNAAGEDGKEGGGTAGGKDSQAQDRSSRGGGGGGESQEQRQRGDKKAAPPPPPAKDTPKVRFAGFVAVEVRGRQVLVKAPVWTLG